MPGGRKEFSFQENFSNLSWELEGQGAWESSHAGVPKPENAKGVLVQNREEERRKLSACIGFLKACARGQRDLWICSKGSNRSPKSHFGSEEERSRDREVSGPC
jgi:hypothetical protein